MSCHHVACFRLASALCPWHVLVRLGQSSAASCGGFSSASECGLCGVCVRVCGHSLILLPRLVDLQSRHGEDR